MTTQPTDLTQDDKLWALLSYLLNPIVPIIVLLMEDKKSRPFIKNNAVQALGFFVVWFVISLITVVGGACFVPLAYIYQIYLAIKAYQGEFVTIPVLTDFMKKQGWLS